MKETNYWKQFLSTGRVEDYLCYRAQEEQKEQREGSALFPGNISFADTSDKGAVDAKDGRQGARDAGLRGSDRDRIEGRFHWGI